MTIFLMRQREGTYQHFVFQGEMKESRRETEKGIKESRVIGVLERKKDKSK